MDIEAEILSLKQRVRTLEESGSDGDARTKPAALPGDAVVTMYREISEELTALGVEIAGMRMQTIQDHTACQAELLGRLDSLQLGMHHLVFRLDQLVDRGSV